MRFIMTIGLLVLLSSTLLIAQPRPLPPRPLPAQPTPVVPGKVAPATILPGKAAPVPVVPGKMAPAPTAPAPVAPPADKSAPATPPAEKTPSKATTEKSAGYGFRDKLIVTRTSVTPAYGQSGQKQFPLAPGTVLQVREERLVDGALFLQTLGGVLRVQDVLLFENAFDTLSKEMQVAEAAKKPIIGYLYLRGLVLHKQGEFDRAADDFTQAMVQADEPNEVLYLSRAESRIEAGKYAEALEDCKAGLKLDPKSAHSLTTRAWVEYQQNQYAAALESLKAALAADANHAPAYLIRGWVLDAQQQTAQAKADLEQVLKLDPLSSSARNSLAWLLATSSDAKFFQPKEALALARLACDWDAYRTPAYLDTLSAAFAANGDFENAVKTQTIVVKIASAKEREMYQARLNLYLKQQPYRSASK